MDDQTTETVQPGEGQGGGGTEAPYAEYLNRIPEEVREQVEPIFKEWDANTTRRFQEHAEFRKGWEPLAETGVNQLSPEEVQWLVQFRGALDSPDTIKQWYDGYAQEHGLTPQEQAAAQQQQQAPTLDEFFGADPGQLETLLQKQLQPLQQQVEVFNQWREQQESAARVAEAERYVQGQIEQLKTKHPDEFNEAAVEKLVANYIESDPQHAVQRAFEDWRAIRAQVERDYAQGKANQPPPAESGGLANVAPEEIKTLAQAAQIAREQLRIANRA